MVICMLVNAIRVRTANSGGSTVPSRSAPVAC
jgi:hypothetical protein